MRRILGLTLVLALPLSLAACKGDDGTGPDGLGNATFEATISGDISGEFSGTAAFGEATDGTGEHYWVLFLTNTSDSSTRALYFGRLGERPSTGSVNIADISSDGPDTGEVFSYFIDNSGQASTGVFGATGGTLTLEQSSGSDMRGSFSLQATGTSIQNGEAVELDITISGTFSAVSGNVGLPGGVF